MITFSFGTDTPQKKQPRNKGKSLILIPENYCIIDIETTGLSPDFDSIIEVSAVKYINGLETDHFTSLIKPEDTYDDGSYIDKFIEELTGITNEMLSTAPDPASVLKQFKIFLGNDILIGHNINFDIIIFLTIFQKHFQITLLILCEFHACFIQRNIIIV